MRIRSKLILLALGAASLAPAAALATTTVLYNGALNNLPTDQFWIYGNDTGQGVQSNSSSTAHSDTTSNIVTRAGWVPLFSPNMDASTGYTLSFTSSVTNESHSSNNRSGFDVVMIGHNTTKSLELAFWSDRVFALNNDIPTFSHGEEALLDTTVLHNYALSVSGSTYTLYDSGIGLLSGPLRDYTASAVTISGIPIYNTPDFLFFGDDTTSALGVTNLQSVSFTNATTPEPASLGLLAMGGLALLRRRR